MTEPPVLGYHFQKNPGKHTILYLHGFLGCKEDWSSTVTQFGDAYSHLTVDLPGHGETAEASLDDHDFTISGCAERLIKLLGFLNIEKCHLAAYSMGGRLGLFLLSNYPAHFERAVIESASPGLQSKDERAARTSHDNRLADELIGSEFHEFLDRWYAQPLFSTLDRTNPRFEELLKRRSQGDPGQLARSLRLMGTGVQPSLWSRLGDIACPVLFVVGELDDKYQRLAERMLPLCPRSQVAIIPGAGHNSHFERPAEYGEAVHRFFSEHE